MPTETDNVSRALEFFRRWEVDYEEMCRSYFDLFTADCHWENMGFSATRGPAEAVESGLDPVHEKGMETIKVDTLKIGEVAGRVWSERVDHVLRADGALGFSVPVVGVMEFTDEGKMVVWKEYFDHNPIVSFMEETIWLPDPDL
jgi:limonene-1,2-epoxide hydrolase